MDTVFISTVIYRNKLCSSESSKKLGVTTQHVILVLIVKQHSHCSSKEEVVAITEDYRKELGHAKKGDID